MTGDFAYLDNAATTWPKPEAVYKAVEEAMRFHGANPGRASHRMSVAAERILDETRHLVARFFNAPSPSHVVFTLNCTDSLNIALKGLIKPGHNVVTGPYEHNSVARPLHSLERKGARTHVVKPTGDLGIDLNHLEDLCTKRLDMAVFSHASNVTGRTHPIEEMSGMVKSCGGLFLVDAAQTVGRVHIDMDGMGIDVLAAPGHKGLFGPMGVGLLILGRDLDLKPLREGGTGFGSEEASHPREMPWRLEAGTPALPAIAGLGAGIRFIKSLGLDAIRAREDHLAATLSEGLRGIPGVRVIQGGYEPENGIVSFTIGQSKPTVAGSVLDQVFGLGVRAGLHCAPDAHKALGTFPDGTLRASFGYFNEERHAKRLVEAVGELSATGHV